MIGPKGDSGDPGRKGIPGQMVRIAEGITCRSSHRKTVVWSGVNLDLIQGGGGKKSISYKRGGQNCIRLRKGLLKLQRGRVVMVIVIEYTVSTHRVWKVLLVLKVLLAFLENWYIHCIYSIHIELYIRIFRPNNKLISHLFLISCFCRESHIHELSVCQK